MNKVIGTTLSELLNTEVNPCPAPSRHIDGHIDEQDEARTDDRIDQWFQEGVSELKKDNFIQAAVKLGAVVLLVPDHVKAINNLAVAYYNLGEKEECITILRQLLELEPENSIARKNLQALLGS